MPSGPFREQYSHCVYVISGPGGRPCKIGIADNICDRFSGIQVSHWLDLELHEIFWMGGRIVTQRVEDRAHEILKKADRHIRGEWFDVEYQFAVKAVKLAVKEIGAPFVTEANRKKEERRLAELRHETMRKKLGLFPERPLCRTGTE